MPGGLGKQKKDRIIVIENKQILFFIKRIFLLSVANSDPNQFGLGSILISKPNPDMMKIIEVRYTDLIKIIQFFLL